MFVSILLVRKSYSYPVHVFTPFYGVTGSLGRVWSFSIKGCEEYNAKFCDRNVKWNKMAEDSVGKEVWR